MANNTPYTPDINNDSADFIPSMGDYKTLQPFRYWCQKVLPLVYDDSLSYYELLCKVVDYLNKTMEDVETLHDDVDDLHTSFGQLQGYTNTSITDLRTDYQNLVNYVNSYFANLNVQNEINNKLDAMALNGTLTALMSPYIPNAVATWMTQHLTPTTPVVDNTLSVSGAAADAKVTGDNIRSLDSRLDGVEDYFIECPNLFNPNDPDIVENSQLAPTSGNITERTGYFVSGYIPVEAGKTLCCHYPVGIYGGRSAIVFYNANKEYLSYHYFTSAEKTTDAFGRNYVKYTFADNPTASYIRLTGAMAYTYYYMYIYADSMPDVYIPYTTKKELSNNITVPWDNITNVEVSKTDTNFVKISPYNLVDLTKLVTGVLGTSSNQAAVDSSVTNWRTTDYIPVKRNTVYHFVDYLTVYYGSAYAGIPWFDSDKRYMGRITPTGTPGTSSLASITTPDDIRVAYIRTSYPKSLVENPKTWYQTMIVEGDWPYFGYLAYDGDYRIINAGLTREFSKQLNPLFGKFAVWDGDSICAADNDPKGGWPFRIANNNGMSAFNYGVAGGCIAENVRNAHSVCGTLDTLIETFPNADYVIIEGGTNDADLLDVSGMGTFDADDFSSAYIEALNKNTFSGALESIFYRLVTQMKGKHIGYVIPQKMGHTAVLVERRRTYFDRAIAICKKWGIPYLDLWDNYYFNWELSAHWNQEMSTTENEEAGNLYIDGQHLTTTGYAIQSPVIAEWMKSI